MTDQARQFEALEALVDSGVSRGAETLTVLLDSKVRLSPPTLRLLDTGSAAAEPLPLGKDILAMVSMAFDGSLKGDSILVFNRESALRLVKRIAGDDLGTSGFDFISEGVLTEIGNIVLNNVLGSISNALEFSLNFVVPCFFQGDAGTFFELSALDVKRIALFINTHFVLEGLQADGSIVLLLERDSYEVLMSAIEKRSA
jgi:chemotaxis protein CheC